MPRRTPPDRPEAEMRDFLIGQWDPAQVRGFSPAVQPSDPAFLPIVTTLDAVGEIYPSLVVSFSNQTSSGETTFDFMTENGPGQSPEGTILATARAEDRDAGYVGDSTAHSATDAETLVHEIAGHALTICRDQFDAPGTEFTRVGGQRGADIPDDLAAEPPVRQAQRQLDYATRFRP